MNLMLCLVASLGAGWTLAYAVAIFFGVRWYLKRRDAKADAGWERTLKAKDEMIEQINSQNREYRVQVLVLGNRFSKDEAVAMVYRDTPSKPAGEPIDKPPSDARKLAK